jgi:hypothetical protein
VGTNHKSDFRKVLRLPAWITTVLAAAAAIALGFGIALALARDDTEVLESPLLLAISRQLEHGPWELYGPFDSRNHLVLIHAPGYYHTAALLAWPLHRLGVEQVDAALAAARAISFGSLLITLAAAYRLCRLDGAARRAAWWSVFLIAASPVVGVMPFTVRPDMLGVALQTFGVVLVLSTVRSDAPKGWMLSAGFVAFALAFCVKQHFITGPVLSIALALGAWRRGRLPFNFIERAVLTGLAVSFAFYGLEELATGGRMSRAVFQAAAAASRVHAGGWFRAYLLLFSLAGRSAGLATLAIAAGLVGLGNRSGSGWRGLRMAGIGLIGLFLARSTGEFWQQSVATWDLLLAFFMLATTAFVALPLCVILARRDLLRQWLDRDLLLYLAGELVLITALGWSSTGSWANYGIQATVFASVLTSRALERVCSVRLPTRAALPVAAAALVVLITASGSAWSGHNRDRSERGAITDILAHFGRPSTEYFFVGRPGDNRIHGRRDLVYDDWLYPAFESIRLAEPRSTWLRQALTDGSVRFIVNTSDTPDIDGLAEPISRLGFIRRIRHGPFFVWERITARG